jgi:hypothetical protein
MKRVIIAMSLFGLSAQLTGAQPIDVEPLIGSAWYGVYMNGQKTGFARNELRKDDTGQIHITQDAQFQMNMMGSNQDMRIVSDRVYAADGSLVIIESAISDIRGETTFVARVEDGALVLDVSMAGEKTSEIKPLPQETLRDALSKELWVREQPAVGDSLDFSLFDPAFQQEVSGTSTVLGVEERVLEGVTTKVYHVKTRLNLMDIDSEAYVTEAGKVLEDVTAGMLTMRLEPEAVAKDVDYSNDVIVSNAAMLNEPIPNARNRQSLRLALRGPINEHHLFNDERQYMTDMGDHVLFVAKRPSLEEFAPAQLPVEDEHAKKWLTASTFVQSDSPELKAKAREIVGDETDTLEITKKLSAWVFEEMHATYSARLTNALEVLKSLEGDCTEHSILFVGLARAAGVPAREVAGVVYVPGNPAGFYYHQWAKVWIGKWIDVDPTMNQWLADVTHIKLAEGDLLEQSKIIPLIGHLQVEYLPDEEDKAAAAADATETGEEAPPAQVEE